MTLPEAAPFTVPTRPFRLPTITYQFSAQTGGTLFERILIYTPPTPLSRFLNFLLLKRNNRSQSKRALKNLKRVLEEQNHVLTP